MQHVCQVGILRFYLHRLRVRLWKKIPTRRRRKSGERIKFACTQWYKKKILMHVVDALELGADKGRTRLR